MRFKLLKKQEKQELIFLFLIIIQRETLVLFPK